MSVSRDAGDMEGNPTMEVDDDLVNLDWGESEAEEVNRFTMIGKIMINKFLNKGAVKALIQRSWNAKGVINITDLKENLFLFNFSEEDDFVRVVRDSPWTIMGNLLVLSEWSELMTIEEIRWRKCQFWVQFHGIPLKGMTGSNKVKMGQKTGDVVAYEHPLLNEGVA